MEEQTRLTKEQIETLMDDRRIKMQEAEAQRNRDQDQIRVLTEKWVHLIKWLCGQF